MKWMVSYIGRNDETRSTYCASVKLSDPHYLLIYKESGDTNPSAMIPHRNVTMIEWVVE